MSFDNTPKSLQIAPIAPISASNLIRAGDTSRDRVRPLAVAKTFQHFCAPQTQPGITGEGDAFTDRVVELDHRHPAADWSARVGTRLSAWNLKK